MMGCRSNNGLRLRALRGLNRVWCAFKEPDDQRVVIERDDLIRTEHFLQIEIRGPELGGLLRVFDGKAEMPDRAKLYFHVGTASRKNEMPPRCLVFLGASLALRMPVSRAKPLLRRVFGVGGAEKEAQASD